MPEIIKIQNLSVSIEKQLIIQNLNLNINSGTVHALMGPNGSGKSTLAYTLLGHPNCNIISGDIFFKDLSINKLSVDKRAKLGIFLAFQYPQEIPGLQIFNFLKEIYTLFKGHIPVNDFKILLEYYMNLLGLDISFAYRNLNEGFSGGQKKRIEMLQLLMLNPSVAILDEIDSGLDIDGLQIVSDALLLCKKNNPEFTLILVTHYNRILNYIKPDFVHIFCKGNIIKSGDYTIANKIEEMGYEKFEKQQLSI